MDELVLIGIGAGNPDHLTRQGEAALRAADAVLIPQKGAGKADLAELRFETCRRILGNEDKIVPVNMPVRDVEGDYHQGVNDWHDAIAQAWQTALAGAGHPTKVAMLIWGDPSLYDSSLRIAARLSPQPKTTVIPGITALQALTAAHTIPLNDVNAPVLITTGRQLRDFGWPKGADTVAVMLDGECSFRHLDPEGIQIWWGAYVGMDNEILATGALAEVSEQIVALRADARAAHGWIMDIYLLRRIQSTSPT
ncbi:MAG: precorrin-6A synthase (deacetylating) [Paracoccaceae bacterium]